MQVHRLRHNNFGLKKQLFVFWLTRPKQFEDCKIITKKNLLTGKYYYCITLVISRGGPEN